MSTMFEIDTVRAVLSHSQPYELSDRLSDRYLRAIDQATAPTFDDEKRMSVGRCLADLNEYSDYIVAALNRYDDAVADKSVVAAYHSTVEQVASLAGVELAA